MTVKKTFLFCICLVGLATSCCNTGSTDPGNDADTSWKTTLEQKLPLLGHRNWIVVTDMAYPLQTNPGITTLYAEEPYADVISTVDSLIGQAPHVFAHVYQDQEQTRLSEALAPGWDEYKESVSKVLGTDDVKLVPHEDLIKRLDEVSNLCQVVIIKTSLTIPYSSTFFELDCGYWDAEREGKVRQAAE